MSDNKPRPYTTEEARETFLKHLDGIADYWAKLPHEGPITQKVMEDRVRGGIFSVLSTIDGCAADLPGYYLIPRPHSDDEAWCREQGENWYERVKTVEDLERLDICNGELHSLFNNINS